VNYGKGPWVQVGANKPICDLSRPTSGNSYKMFPGDRNHIQTLSLKQLPVDRAGKDEHEVEVEER